MLKTRPAWRGANTERRPAPTCRVMAFTCVVLLMGSIGASPPLHAADEPQDNRLPSVEAAPPAGPPMREDELLPGPREPQDGGESASPPSYRGGCPYRGKSLELLV